MSTSDLYPLADALQLNLEHGKNLIVSGGNEKRSYQIGNFRMKLDTKIKASGLDDKFGWVLVKVKGLLHLMMTIDLKSKRLDAFVVDGGCVPLTKEGLEKINGKAPMFVLSTIFEGIVAVYALGYDEEQWKKGNLDDFIVDSGQAGDPEEDGSPTVQ